MYEKHMYQKQTDTIYSYFWLDCELVLRDSDRKTYGIWTSFR